MFVYVFFQKQLKSEVNLNRKIKHLFLLIANVKVFSLKNPFIVYYQSKHNYLAVTNTRSKSM